MNSTLMNGLTLLQVLADAPEPHSVSELARQSGLPKSHIHRLLQTLVESAYVNKTAERKYAIGVGAFRLGHALLRNLPARTLYLPRMLEAVKGMRLPLTLALPFRGEAISVAHVFQDGRIRNNSETLGTLLPASSTALGKLFLAHQEQELQAELLARIPLTSSAPNAYRSAEALAADFPAILEQGFSLNNEHGSAGKASVGIPIFNEQGELEAGVGASGSVDEVLPRLQELLEGLRSILHSPEPYLETLP